jgi:hypothetical protein
MNDSNSSRAASSGEFELKLIGSLVTNTPMPEYVTPELRVGMDLLISR